MIYVSEYLANQPECKLKQKRIKEPSRKRFKCVVRRNERKIRITQKSDNKMNGKKIVLI